VRINDLQIHIVRLGRDFHLPLHGNFRAEAGIVRLLTDAGIEGNADFCTWAVPPRVLAEQILSLKPHLIGEDPLDIERLWAATFQATRSAISIYAPGCINVALWDIMGKVADLPLYRLLGGFRDRIRAYASTQSCPDTKAFLRLVKRLVDQGFTAIKLHPWGDPDRDMPLCRAVRKAVGSKIDLMIDPLGLYDRRGALRVGRVLEELNFFWYEEPLPEADVNGYIELCRTLDVPVLGVDSLRLTLGHYADYIARGALDIVQADAARQGISWTRKLASLAEAFGRKFQAHAYGTSLHQAANLHLMGAINNGEFFEMPVPEGILDIPTDRAIALDDDGWVTLPQKPGLGMPLDWKRLKKMTTAVMA
jgi:L-alanine-DL-glutamate epimerase-like enolase superfamily enzyme